MNKEKNKMATASNAEIGAFIKKLREERNLTQDELADQIHYSRYVISRIERGETAPNYDKLQVLAKFFGISVYEIYAAKRISRAELKNITVVVKNIIESIDMKYKNKLKIILFTFAISTFCLLLTFFAYYFFNSYNSVKLYKVFGDNKEIKTNDGLFVLTKDNIYFNLSVSSVEGNTIDKVSLRYRNEKEDNLVYSSDSSDIFLVDFYGYEAVFNYKDIIKETGTLYIEVEYDGIKEKVDLSMDKMYENKKVIFKKTEKITTGEKASFKEYSVPKKIEKDFAKGEDGNYYLKLVEKELTITLFYDSELNQFIVGEENKKLKNNRNWIYYLEQKVLDYSYMENLEIVDAFSIDINDMKEKESKVYKHFKEKYIDKYLK